MKKNIFVILVIGLFISHLFSNDPLEVPSQYPTIGEAIIAAELLTGAATIEVSSDTYEENLWIDLDANGLNSLSLIGVDGAGICIIDGNGSGDVINVTGDENTTLTISGFTITESGDNSNDKGIDLLDVNLYLDNCIIESCKFGMYVRSTAFVQCTDNEFYSNNTMGKMIEAYRVEELLIKENYFENYGDDSNNGINLWGTTGNIYDNEFIDFGVSVNLLYLGNYPNTDINISRNIFNLIDNGGATINIQTCENLKISNNIFLTEVLYCDAIVFYDTQYNSGNITLIEENLFDNFDRAIYSWGSSYTHIYTIVDLINNTFCNSLSTALYLSHSNSLRYCKNNIFYNNEADLITSSLSTDQTPSFSYNLFEENIFATNPTTWNGGNNQIGINPNFVYPAVGNYNLQVNSYCIDHADPDTNGINGDYTIDEDDRDPDGSRKDIGCYTYLHEYDTKYLGKGYNWESFPKLERDEEENEEADIVLVLNNPTNFTPYNFTYLAMETNDSDEFPELTWDALHGWDPNPYEIRSSWLCKIMSTPEEERELKVYGTRLEEELVLDSDNDHRFPLAEYEYHWIGYWLQESKNIEDALANCWDDIERVKAENWYYDKCINNREIGDPQPVSWSTEGKTMVFGKGYMIWFKQGSGPITSFHWGEGGTVEEPTKKAESENFNYTEKPDYEVIDVVDIPENVSEIGVFQDDVCVGAVVVTNPNEQILVYCDNMSREPIPFNFEIITNNRSLNLPIKNYKVFNKDSREFENGYVVSGQQEASIVLFGDIGEPQNDLPEVIEVELHNNYPNPFNPETNICFSISEDKELKLTIYNLKGQKVRQLVNGDFTSGTHLVVWNGIDDNGKQLGSGLYFYKLKTNEKTISKKMLLLK